MPARLVWGSSCLARLCLVRLGTEHCGVGHVPGANEKSKVNIRTRFLVTVPRIHLFNNDTRLHAPEPLVPLSRQGSMVSRYEAVYFSLRPPLPPK